MDERRDLRANKLIEWAWPIPSAWACKDELRRIRNEPSDYADESVPSGDKHLGQSNMVSFYTDSPRLVSETFTHREESGPVSRDAVQQPQKYISAFRDHVRRSHQDAFTAV